MQYEEQRPAWGMLLAVIGVALLVGAIGGGIAGAFITVLLERDEPAASRDVPGGEPAKPTTLLTVKEESAITDAVKKVLPGVVTLIVQSSRTDAAGRVFVSKSLGSGVVVDARGYVVTNQHVVENASKITIKLASGEERPGVLVGDDSPFTDIAVVRVQPDNLAAVSPGDSDALELGQQVLAIGSVAFGSNALDFRNNVTRGIVSGLGRRYRPPRDNVALENLIQTDAAVNHGNSGGALVTLTGELVGLTTSVVRETSNGFQVQGVAFAIPTRAFMPLVDEIIRTGKVQRPYIGVRPQHITEELARQNGLPIQGGALVLDVVPDSPAARAGIRANDIITRLGGAEITEDTPYLNVLLKQRPNSTVPISIFRGGRELTVDVEVGLR